MHAVIAKSYECTHRSNLLGMDVLPLQFPESQNAESLGLSGEETSAITGLDGCAAASTAVQVKATGPRGQTRGFEARVRIDTPVEAAYY